MTEETDLDFTKAKDTVLIELSNIAISQRESVLESEIPIGLKSFIVTAIDQATQINTNTYIAWRVDILENINKTKSIILNSKKQSDFKKASNGLFSIRIKDLKDKNIGVSFVHSSKNIKTTHRHKINSFLSLLHANNDNENFYNKRKKRLSANIIQEQKNILSKSGGMMIGSNNLQDLILYQEQMFNGIVDTCMRVSRSDKRKSIKTIYYIKNEPIEITSSCSTEENMELLMLSDQRAMRSIISLCKKEVEFMKKKLKDQHGSGYHPRLIPNIFHILIDDVCDLMEITKTKTNIASVVDMLTRLSDTQFKIDASQSSWFKDNFSMMFDVDENGEKIQSNIYRIRLLTNFESAIQNDTINKTIGEEINPRFFTFSLENRLFYSLISEGSTNIFLSHKELSSEKSGIIQRFYNWSRGKFGGSGSRIGLEKKWWSGKEMLVELIPHETRYDNFIKYFLRALLKKEFLENNKCFYDSEKQEGLMLVYGFYVNYKKTGPNHFFKFSRDKNDHVVGDNSLHNIQVRKTQKLLGEI